MPNPETIALRRKMLGIKLRNARLNIGLHLSEVGSAIELNSEAVTEIEEGQRDVTLPQLEVMALLYNHSVTYFLSEADDLQERKTYPTREAMELRRRIMGVLFQQARKETGKSHADLATLLGVSTTTVQAYEAGQEDIPLPQLEELTETLKLTITTLLESGITATLPEDTANVLDQFSQFSRMEEDVREFLSNPANELYLRIAMRLSKLSVETLRGMAEGLLEVTY